MGLVFSEMNTGERSARSSIKLLGRNIAPLHFKTEREAEIALCATRFPATLAGFAGTWGIFSSTRDSKLTLVGFSF